MKQRKKRKSQYPPSSRKNSISETITFLLKSIWRVFFTEPSTIHWLYVEGVKIGDYRRISTLTQCSIPLPNKSLSNGRQLIWVGNKCVFQPPRRHKDKQEYYANKVILSQSDFGFEVNHLESEPGKCFCLFKPSCYANCYCCSLSVCHLKHNPIISSTYTLLLLCGTEWYAELEQERKTSNCILR